MILYTLIQQVAETLSFKIFAILLHQRNKTFVGTKILA